MEYNHKKRNILFIFYVMLIFLLVNMVVAVPPSTVIDIQEGLVIDTADPDYFMYGSTIRYNFHIYNASGKHMNTTGITCLFHLYNNSGYHIINTNSKPSYGGYDMYVDLNTSIITYKGQYPVLISCEENETQSSIRTGYFDSVLTITDKAENPEPEFMIALLPILVLIPLIIIILPYLFNFTPLITFIVRLASIGFVVYYPYLLANLAVLMLRSSKYLNAAESVLKYTAYYIWIMLGLGFIFALYYTLTGGYKIFVTEIQSAIGKKFR